MNFFIKAEMQSFVNPCPIIQCSVSIIRRNSGHYRYPDESAYPDVLGGALTEITVSRPEVVNENTDVICSTSVRSRSLEYDNFPEISEANILSTFEQLHQNKDEVFERGVINVFKGLSWDYKTNSPCKFGSKIIVNNLVRWDQWGFHLISGMQADRLADLERMLHLLSGKPIPDNRGNITINLDDHIQSVQGKGRYEDEMFIIKYFKKGSAHITFKRLELIDRINDIIARHFPSVLSA